jgi:hypothetical protein
MKIMNIQSTKIYARRSRIAQLRNERGGAYVPLMIMLASVLALLAMQLAVSSAQLRSSQLHSRYAGLYNLAASAAEAEVAHLNSLLAANPDAAASAADLALFEESALAASGTVSLDHPEGYGATIYIQTSRGAGSTMHITVTALYKTSGQLTAEGDAVFKDGAFTLTNFYEQ